jgi:ADP-heptose:LPS heptosyltransferase
MRDRKHILLMRVGRMGDFLVAVPAIADVRAQNPDAIITLISTTSLRSGSRRLARRYVAAGDSQPWVRLLGSDLVDRSIVVESMLSLAGARAVWAAMRSSAPDVAVVLPTSRERWQSGLAKLALLRLLGVRCPIFGTGRRFLKSLPLHQVAAARAAVAEAGLISDLHGPGSRPARPAIAPDVVACSQGAMAAKFDTRRPTVAVYAGSTFEHKRWPADRFVALIDALDRSIGVNVVLIGSSHERVWADEIERSIGTPCWNACGQTSLEQLCAILAQCRLFVGNDGGPSHLSAFVGIPTVSIFSGIHEPGVWEPFGEHALSVRAAVPCSPCRSEYECPLKTFACIRDIAVRDVLVRCEKLLLFPRSGDKA